MIIDLITQVESQALVLPRPKGTVPGSNPKMFFIRFVRGLLNIGLTKLLDLDRGEEEVFDQRIDFSDLNKNKTVKY